MRIAPTIRFATKEDILQIVELCEAHADYEKAVYDAEGKVQLLGKALFGPSPKFFCLVADKEGTLVGYATYMKQFSTWDAAAYVYMDCLYLKEYVRGLGIGAKFIDRIRDEGKKIGCDTMQWQTPTFNVRAINFYERLGAHSKTKERFFLDI
ncbi:GNAT family N-acetyltransferase [Sungkyunkwania multivorans]|uniref:GNAT family N-acetyltransferase n=1 Tax=Sungkyunkwania multivorans TaxID=1173618 RepID=A0ABW3CZ93_9FLAO